MQIDVVQLLVQAGALGLFAFFLWKMFWPMLKRLMDNLDAQNAHYIEGVKVQAEVAADLRALCERLDDCDKAHGKRAAVHDAQQAEIQDTQEKVVAVLRGINQQFQAHEARAAARHEQQMAQGQQQMAEANERNAEIIKVLKGMNGHS